MARMTETRAESRAERRRRPLLRSYRFWIPVGLLLVLIVTGAVAAIIGKQVYERAMAARSSLVQAMPLAAKAADQVLAGDNAGAKTTTAQLEKRTADARAQTDGDLWRSLEWIPVAGPNLHAVRTAAAVTDDLVTGALMPATDLSLDALQLKDGAIDLGAVADMQNLVAQAATVTNRAAEDLDALDREALIDDVDTALDRLTASVDELQTRLTPASEILGVLPAALGAEEPRHYLMMFQNNAESRGTGGNPAALVMIDVDKGRISIGQQASSGDFRNGRPEPVIALNPETQALYGDKVGRWIPDATMTPDFTETATIMRAWWAEEFGTPIDGVVSFDPVALSYLLAATGPAVVPNDPIEIEGRQVRVLDEPVQLTAETAVPYLLNGVYWQYSEARQQDAVFAAAARSIFDVITAGGADPRALIDSLVRAVDEGRLMYQPATDAEAQLIAGSKISGTLPDSNDETVVVGAYVNDFTTSKLDYYMQLDLAASSTQCTAPDTPVFTLTATLTNTLTPQLASDLPRAISPAKFFPKGHVATNLVLYGPVGVSQAKVTVDGKEQSHPVLPHLGRSAVLVPIHNTPGQSHTVTVEFAAEPGDYGPLEVRHTPMVRPTPVDVTTPGCG